MVVFSAAFLVVFSAAFMVVFSAAFMVVFSAAFLVVFSAAFLVVFFTVPSWLSSPLPSSLVSQILCFPCSFFYLLWSIFHFHFARVPAWALLSSYSFFFCSFSSAASFWHPFFLNWATHSALVRKHARGRVFGPVSVKEVSSTRYLDMGEIDFSESGVSDGWPCYFFQESG